jgi:hypothetical protein
MEDDNESNVDLSPNPVTLLQRRHTKPLSSHKTYLQPQAQPKSVSEARGENPWTGQTADEVREAAYSQHQFQRLQEQTGRATSNSKEPAPKLPSVTEELERSREFEWMMHDTAM